MYYSRIRLLINFVTSIFIKFVTFINFVGRHFGTNVTYQTEKISGLLTSEQKCRRGDKGLYIS